MSLERSPYFNVMRQRNRSQQIDTHEILKREIFSQNGSSDTNYQFSVPQPQQQTYSSPIPPPMQTPPPAPARDVVGIEDTYLMFDSLAKDTSSNTAAGELRFSIPALNNNQAIDNCVEMRLGSFYFPLRKNAAGSPEYYYFRRIYMQIMSVPSTQSIRGQGGILYHFEFDIETLGSVAVKLTPVNSKFYFRQPLNTITEFAMRFMVPSGNSANFKRIELPRDIIRVRPVPGSNPARFNILSGDTVVNFLEPAPGAYPYVLSPTEQVAIYIDGFNSGDVTLNNATNTPAGLIVTTLVTATQFEVAALSFAALGAPVTPDQYDCFVTIAKNRICIPVRFTTIKTHNTNYLQPIHD